MDSQLILHGGGKKADSDEAYTPAYGVKPIIKHIEKLVKSVRFNNTRKTIVWCPFDKSDSEFVKQIQKIDSVDVVFSHIDDRKDFFTYEPTVWDIMVSNPPFKNKRLFFERALKLNKPFALLMTCAWLNDKYSKWVFYEAKKEMQLLMFDKRIHFLQNGKTRKDTTFSSAYFCSDFLESQIIIEEIENG